MKTGFRNRRYHRCGCNLYLDKAFYVEGSVMDWQYDQESCLQCGYITYENESPQTEIEVTTTTAQRELLLV